MNLALLLLLALPAAAVRAAGVLTLEEAVAAGLEDHPRAVAARAEADAAAARGARAYAAYYPQISIAADWTRSRAFYPILGSGSLKETEVHSASAQLKQTLYDFGRTSGAAKAARLNRAAAEQARAAARQDAALRVREAYYLVLAAERQVAAEREAAAAKEEVFRQARGYFDEGVRSKLDVSRAEAELHAARAALIRAENNRDLARVELAGSMGRPGSETRALAEPAAALAEVPDREEARRLALAGSADVRRLDSLLGAARADASAARSDYLPVLSGAASAGRADGTFPPHGNVWSAGIGLSVPVFSGFSTREKAREADAALRAVAAEREDTALAVGKRADAAWLAVREAAARVESAGKQEEAARESRTLAGARYREGVGSIIEVTDAQSSAIDAETARIQATYDAMIARARLERALGKE
ncbi:MAG: TolC family protein [Elusimicrobia bacterium]|nr:TolC family protein [Elusimicrobiota bacterium]